MGNLCGKPLSQVEEYGSAPMNPMSLQMNNSENADRRSVKRAHRKRIAVAAEAIKSAVDVDIVDHPKSDSVRKLIRTSCQGNLLFSSLTHGGLEAIVNSMAPSSANAGDNVITQGELNAEKFYVVERGECEAYVESKEGGSELVLSYGSGGAFGELALLYNSPRAATVRAKTQCNFWVMDRNVYTAIKRIDHDKQQNAKMELLSKVPILTRLSEDHRMTIAEALEEVEIEAGSTVFSKGDEGDYFYIVKEGCCKVFDENMSELTTVNAGGYFGERALLTSDPRAATVKAEGYVICYALSRANFISLLGEIQEVFTVEALLKVSILSSLKESQLLQLARLMARIEYAEGSVVFSQGEEGDSFYIIDEGSVSIRVASEDGTAKEVAVLEAGAFFGEQALMKSDTRNATAITKGNTRLLVLDRDAFQVTLGRLEDLQVEWRKEQLRRVPILRHLKTSQLQQLVGILELRSYRSGQDIVSFGEEGDEFFVMEKGSVAVKDEEGKQLTELNSGAYFGELALLKNDTRAATITAITDITVQVMSRGAFTALLGPLQTILEKHAMSYVPTKKIHMGDLQVVACLGLGAFGKVLLVRHDDNTYALKCLQKSQIVGMGLQDHVRRERNLMMECMNPFLVNLVTTFKDSQFLYMLMETVMGGELFTYLQNKDSPLSESDACFYAACVIEAFSYLQDRDILYRDLKPENLLLDNDGYLKVADFGFAKKLHTGKTYTMCGTPDYLAPELVQQTGHNKAVDWWALGVLIYEMVVGFPPFYDDDQMLMFKNITNVKVHFPKNMSKECRALLKSLLQKNPTRRLGCLKNGAQDVRDHPWFKNFDWQALRDHTMVAPYVPPLNHSEDTSNFEHIPLEEEHPGASHGRRYISTGIFKDFDS